MPYGSKKARVANPHEVNSSTEPKDERGRVPNPSERSDGEAVNNFIPRQRDGSISTARRTPRFLSNQYYR